MKRPPGSRLRIRNTSRDTLLADRAGIADSTKTRKVGLLKHACLEPGDGLWITPCEAVHTIGMKFPIDVLFLDRKLRVVKIRRDMPQWRLSGSFRAHSVLELPSGTAEATQTVRGDQLAFEPFQP
jgi:uncharacterized membrane protein (UPF0127 family)